ncbi:XRE family transcriptional regulator [Paenibacillus dendritiformis]|uniref:hypothetical protein n=1 Tax=Paenibacillus dendritiformis TaxID=130049 RepID=UPI0018CF8AAD|nr:hypothetical protein [Paenibacillus dendritiformis]MBG9794831.1 XRE family transcriptional regulator [Paenibacillus dendritiformis]MBG9795241.1 XRE family transcriptional regulator [Paenibacillus dendritiformis]MBG9796063.1 XRE family transcriptional regulator [Paenibacillus dendritiformis]
MTIRKEDLYNLVDRLQEQDQNTAFDFLQFLIDRSEKKGLEWKDIDCLEPDNEPLSKEEAEQLKSASGFLSGEDAKNEFGLQVDLP